MENCGNPGVVSPFGTALRSACSACAGDYQDPDHTAWTDEIDEAGETDEAEQPEHHKLARDEQRGKQDASRK